MAHALKCRKDGLVYIRQNNVCGEASQCGVLGFSKLYLSHEPSIFYSKIMTATVVNTSHHGGVSRVLGDKAIGDVAIKSLWKRGETCILDICGRTHHSQMIRWRSPWNGARAHLPRTDSFGDCLQCPLCAFKLAHNVPTEMNLATTPQTLAHAPLALTLLLPRNVPRSRRATAVADIATVPIPKT